MEERDKNAVNRALQMPLEAECEKAIQARIDADEGAVLALMDVDAFYQVNTEFGIAEGDRVLIETGRFLRDSIGEQGSCYRVGGDEFAVLFAEETEKEEAFLRMEALRRAYAVALPDGQRQTISIGIAALNDDGVTTGELLRKAEAAMFRAKAQGRDRVCLARDEKMVTKTTHYGADQLQRLTKVSKREGIGEATLLREALDMLLKKYHA